MNNYRSAPRARFTILTVVISLFVLITCEMQDMGIAESSAAPQSGTSLSVSSQSAVPENPPDWSADTLYDKGGIFVSHKGKVWVSQWHVARGAEPGANTWNGWKLAEEGSMDKAGPNPWSAHIIYNAKGFYVTHDESLWVSQWPLTRGAEPGANTWNGWKRLGPAPKTVPLPTMSYTEISVSKDGDDTERAISVVLSGGLGAAEADYAFEPASSKPEWLSVDDTGTISGTLPAEAAVGSVTYTIRVTGKGIYAGGTQDITFTLRVTDTCFDALNVSCDEFEEAYLKASNTGVRHQFGFSVSLSGDTLAVGADQEEGRRPRSGAVYVFTRSGSTWSQQAYLKAADARGNAAFGHSVSLSGDTLAVSARSEASRRGAVYVFTRSGSTWSQQARLISSNIDQNDYFGESIAVSGDTLAVGADFEDSSAAGVNGDQYDNSAPFSGAVYVFTRSGGAWSQQAYLKASNTGAGDRFGRSVALSGDTLAVGAPREDSSVTSVNGLDTDTDNSAGDSGAVYVFTRTGNDWAQQAYLKASNIGAGDWFGRSVTLSGDTLAVGAPQEDSSVTGVNGRSSDNSAGDSGAVYVFTRSGNDWSQQAYLKASNTGAGDRFGQSAALSGNTLAVGAIGEDSSATGLGGSPSNNSAGESGAVYVFTRSGGTWSQLAYLKASNTGADDWFGRSVSLSGERLAVGAYREESSATGVNGDQNDNSALYSGAVYIRRIAP